MFLLLAGMVVLGPERLPGVMRKAGRVYGELRRMANGYEREFKDTFAEPIREFRSAAREIETEVRGFGKVDTAPSPPMRPERAVAPTEAESAPTEAEAASAPGQADSAPEPIETAAEVATEADPSGDGGSPAESEPR